MDSKTRTEELLARVFAEGGGVPAPGPEAVRGLALFVAELVRWNRKYSLTGLRTERLIVEQGVYSSARVARWLAAGERVVDVGSGNGLPGLVLALLLPGARFTLVERSARKASFLKTAAAAAGCGNVAVVAGEAESLVGGEPFDAALSMAVFAPERWVGLGGALVRGGGKLFVLGAGRRPPAADAFPGFAVEEFEAFALPWSRVPRSITLLRK